MCGLSPRPPRSEALGGLLLRADGNGPLTHGVGGDDLQERRLDVLPAAGLVAGEQRGEDALDRELAGAVGHAGQRLEHGAFPLPGRHPVHAARLGGHDRVVALDVPVGALGTEAGDRAVDQPWILLRQLFVADADAVGDAGAEVLEYHVGGGRELAGGVDALRLLEVEHDAALAAAPLEEGRLLTLRRSSGGLDLDHVRAVVRQHHGGDGAAHPPAEVEDSNPVAGLR